MQKNSRSLKNQAGHLGLEEERGVGLRSQSRAFLFFEIRSLTLADNSQSWHEADLQKTRHRFSFGLLGTTGWLSF